MPFYSKDVGIVFYSDVGGLMINVGISEYRQEEWRFVVDNSKRSLQSIHLHNGNQYGSILIAHFTTVKNDYQTVKEF